MARASKQILQDMEGSDVRQLEKEVQELRQRTRIQEESLAQYRTEAERMVSGGQNGDGRAAGMMKAWLRDARRQNEDLKSMYEQNKSVSADSAALVRRELESTVSRLKQEMLALNEDLQSANEKREKADSDLEATKNELVHIKEDRDAAQQELMDALEQHRKTLSKKESTFKEELAKAAEANIHLKKIMKEQEEQAAHAKALASAAHQKALLEMKDLLDRSRESREREREASAAMFEVSEKKQAKKFEAMQTDINKMTEQWCASQERVNELNGKLASAQSEKERLGKQVESERIHMRGKRIDDWIEQRQRLSERAAASLAFRIWALLVHDNAAHATQSIVAMRGRSSGRKTRLSFRVWREIRHKLSSSAALFEIRMARHVREAQAAVVDGWHEFARREMALRRLLARTLQARERWATRRCLEAWRGVTAVGRAGEKRARAVRGKEVARVMRAWEGAVEQRRRVVAELERKERERDARRRALAMEGLREKAERGRAAGRRAGAMRVRGARRLEECVLRALSEGVAGGWRVGAGIARMAERRAVREGRDAIRAWREVQGRSKEAARGRRRLWVKREEQECKESFRAWRGRTAWKHRLMAVGFRLGSRREVLEMLQVVQRWRSWGGWEREKRAELLVVEDQRDVAEAEAEELRSRVAGAEDAVKIAERVRRVQEGELERMQGEEERLTGELQSAREGIGMLQVQMEAREGEVEGAKTQVRVLQSTLEGQQELLAGLRAAAKEVSEGGKNKKETKGDAVLEKELGEERKRRVGAEREMEMVKEEAAGLRGRVLVLEGRVTELEEEVEEAGRCEVCENGEGVRRDLELGEQEQRRLKAELEAREAEARAAEAHAMVLQAAMEEMRTGGESGQEAKEGELKALREALEAERDKAGAEREKMKEGERKRREAERELEERRGECSSLMAQLAAERISAEGRQQEEEASKKAAAGNQQQQQLDLEQVQCRMEEMRAAVVRAKGRATEGGRRQEAGPLGELAQHIAAVQELLGGGRADASPFIASPEASPIAQPDSPAPEDGGKWSMRKTSSPMGKYWDKSPAVTSWDKENESSNVGGLGKNRSKHSQQEVSQAMASPSGSRITESKSLRPEVPMEEEKRDGAGQRALREQTERRVSGGKTLPVTSYSKRQLESNTSPVEAGPSFSSIPFTPSVRALPLCDAVRCAEAAVETKVERERVALMADEDGSVGGRQVDYSMPWASTTHDGGSMQVDSGMKAVVNSAMRGGAGGAGAGAGAGANKQAVARQKRPKRSSRMLDSDSD